ncbi:MAG: S8 family serine peptidase [Bacteroidota bacterium]
MNKMYLLTCLLFLIGVSPLFSQTQHPHYLDGQLYVKLFDRSPVELGSIQDIQKTQSPKVLIPLLDEYGLEEVGLAFPLIRTPYFQHTYLIRFSHQAGTEELIKTLEAWSEVELVERVPLNRKGYTPNDPNQGNQYALNLIDAFQAWDLHQGGNAVIAIVDDAVKITHQDLAPNLWVNPGEIPNNGLDDDNNGFIDDINGWDAADQDNNPNPPGTASNFNFTHGTHCAGIASAATDNGVGIASVGFDTKLMSVKCTYDSAANTNVIYTGYEGVQYAMASGADVISMSWGGPGFSSVIQNLLNQAFNQGIVLVAAAGNDNTTQQFYPAGYNNVISVASTTSSDTKSSFSNYGSWITISAPGSSIFSTLAGSNSSYGNQSGTSMATPMVAGLAGLLKSYNPSATPTEILNCLTSTADDLDALNPNFAGLLGAGRINAFAAVQCINPNVAPVVNFSADITAGCPGFTTQFTDQSTGNPNSWSWSFPGGTPASSTQQNPSVTYNSPGTYNVSLTSTNGFGTGSETVNGYITVYASGQSLPFVETFESGSFGTNGWNIDNPDNSFTWELATIGGTSPGNTAAKLDFYNYSDVGQRDGLATPPLNFTGLSSAQLTFDHAYRRYNTNSTDSLIIRVSTDCGATFPFRVFAGGEDGNGAFATDFTNTSPFTPSTSDDWCTGPVGADCFTVDLSAFVGNNNVVVRFESYSNYQNNLFLDNINISGTSVNQAPVASFSANTTFGCAPLSVDFTDTSSPSATSWSWSFPGGTPNTSSQQTPTVVYNSPGTYSVTLTATNNFGSDVITQNNFITVNSCNPTACDTLDNFNNGTPTLYAAMTGYVAGHNNFGDVAKAEFYTNSATYLTGVLYNFAVAHAANANSTVALNVWDDNGPAGAPGTILATQDVLIADIDADIQAGNATFINFGGPVNVGSGNFYVGFELNYGAGGAITDTLAMITNQDLETSPSTAWEQWDNGSWFAYDDGSSWGLEIAHAIFAFTTNTLPTAAYTPDLTQVCLGGSITFTNNSTNASDFEWILPGAIPYAPTDANPTVMYDTAGVHEVNLIAYGECFTFDVATVPNQISVTAPPSLNVISTTNESCGQGNGSATVNASGGAGGFSYQWNTTPVQSGPTATGLSFGTYEVTVADASGCTNSLSVSISDQAGPVASVDSWTNESCGQNDGTALASASGGTLPITYSWNTNPGQTGPQATGLGANTYIVTATDASGCSSTASVTITGSPSVDVVAVGTDAPCGNDGTASASVSGGTAPFAYLWDTNPPQSSQTATGLLGGTYTVTVTDGAGCTDQASVSIQSQGTPPIVDLGTDTIACETLDLDGANPGSTYQWSNGELTQLITVLQSGNYSVMVTDGNGCIGEDSIFVQIDQAPLAAFTYLEPFQGSLIFTNTSTGGDADTYLWGFGDGTSSDEAAPSHTYNASGTFTITLVVSNTCGADTLTETYLSTVGVGQEAFERLVVFPNPASELVQIEWELDEAGPIHLRLLNPLGQLIDEQQLSHPGGSGQYQLSVADLAEGNYLLQLISAERQSTHRIEVRH